MNKAVIKKDGTREKFNIEKVIVAINKSAYRTLYSFRDKEIDEICDHVKQRVAELPGDGVSIAQMHNIVEEALERTNPKVAKSYRDYRNYKIEFVHMMDEVYKKSQSIMYIGDK